jgi:hypothetical protein
MDSPGVKQPAQGIVGKKLDSLFTVSPNRACAPLDSALRQEGHVYRPRRLANPPSARRAMCLFIRKELENIFGLVSNIEPLQQRQVFTPETPLRMMLLLVANLPNYRIQVRMRVRECAKSLLPVEPPFDPYFALDEIG